MAFDRAGEAKRTDRSVHKLVTLQNPTIIHGLISISDAGDQVYLHLIESAEFNKGTGKVYNGVPANLVAFACKVAFEKGYDGIVAFVAKTQLVEHYRRSLGAKVLTGNKMYIDTKEAFSIVKQYFKTFKL